jgi:hypothetical protein
VHRLAGLVEVVKQPALAEERRVGRVQVLGRDLGRKRPPAECDHPASRVGDREHDPVAEAVIGDLDVLAGHEQARLGHRLGRDALARKVVAQRVALARCIPDAECRLDLGAEAAPGEVFARVQPGAALERGFEEGGRELDDVVQAAAPRVVGPRLARFLRQRDPRLAREPLDRFREGQPLSFHEEGEDVAVLARREAVVEGLLVVDEEGRRLLGVER